ncbi:MAG: hypothetical protein WA040_14820 [Anaerolineae bacterium]
MSIKLGVYDFFAYTIPGVFYLLIGIVALALFGVTNVDLQTVNSLSLVGAVLLAGAGYATGLVMDPLAMRWHGRFGPRQREKIEAFGELMADYPHLTPRFNAHDRSLLLAFLRRRDMELVGEIERYNVNCIMLRNLSLGLALMSLLFVAYFVFVVPFWPNLIIAAVCAGLSVLAARQGLKFKKWYYDATFTAATAEAMRVEDLFEETPRFIRSAQMTNASVHPLGDDPPTPP